MIQDIQQAFLKEPQAMRWLTRFFSLAISGGFMLIIWASLTNDDPPQGVAIPLLVLLGLTIFGCLAAWRWEKVGGALVILMGVGLSILSYISAFSFGLGPLSLVMALLFGGSFMMVGYLFWVCGRYSSAPLVH